MLDEFYKKDEPKTFQGKLFLKYEGKNTSNHTFDAELYAQSLLGFCNSFKKANKILFDVDTQVDIIAEKEGSVEAIIQFFVDNYNSALIANTYIELFNNFVEAVGKAGLCFFFAYKGLIKIIKESKGKKEKIIEFVKGLRLCYDLTKKLLDILFNKTFRKGLDQLTYFLTSDPMDYIEMSQSDNDVIVINKTERLYFVEQPEDEITIDVDEKIVSVIYPSAQRTKWRFIIDNQEKWAEITDSGFLKKMHDKPLEYFEGIRFKATVETTTVKKVNSVKPEITRQIYNFSTYNPPKQIGLKEFID